MRARLIHSIDALSKIARRRSRARVRVVTACAALALALVPRPAAAVTAADIMELARAGLGDEVLIALIQTDNTVFPLDAARILDLRAAGVSEAVIVAMLRNGRARAEAPAADWPDASLAPVDPMPAGETAVVEYDDLSSSRVPVADIPSRTPRVAWPTVLYVPHPVVAAPARASRHQAAPPYRGFGRFINNGWVEHGGVARTSP